jgi:hypothetical protein
VSHTAHIMARSESSDLNPAILYLAMAPALWCHGLVSV